MREKSTAIVTATPPTIPADASIRVAPNLLTRVGISPQINRLLGEVELCLVWEKVGAVTHQTLR